jgi:molybdate transport system substrate-binding protein
MANVTLETASGDMLANQMQTGSLDAAVIYRSNVTAATETLDAVAIPGTHCFDRHPAVGRLRRNRLIQTWPARLFEQINSAGSRRVFEAEGFRLVERSETAAHD